MNTSQNRLATACIAVAVVGFLSLPAGTTAGWIEERDGKTIIHVKVFSLSDPSATDAPSRAAVAVEHEFKTLFSKLFAERYRDRYKADSLKYGRHNWDNVEVQLEAFTGIEVEGVETDLLAIAGGLAPDVLYINFRKSDSYIRSGFLHPLDKPEDGYLMTMSQEELDFRVHPKIWQVIRRKGPSGEKHVWALPYGGALGKVLMFRKDLFDKHGIAYPTPEWTWEDLLAAAKKIADPENGIYGFTLMRGKRESWFWVTFLWSAGAEVMEYDEATDQWRCVFNGPGAAEALDFYTRLSAEKWVDAKGRIRRGYSAKDAADVPDKWDRGEIGMMFGYIDEKLFMTIDPEVHGMVPVPYGPTGKRGGELNNRMMGLYADIRELAVRDAAWEYIRFFGSMDAARISTRVMVKGGLGRFINPKYLRMFGYPEFERLSPKGWAETFEIAINTSRPEPYGRNSNLAFDLMTLPIQRAEEMALNDELPSDPKERLKLMQRLLDEGCARANREMIGIVPPEEQRKRRLTAAVVLVAIVIAFAYVIRRVTRTFTPPAEPGRAHKGWAFRRYKWAYLLLMPAVLAILVWQYVPLLRGSVMALQDYRLMGNSVWVGVDNFGDVLYDSFWWQAVWNSLRFSLLVMALTFVPPIVLAILLQEVPRGKILFRIIYYLPAVSTSIVTVLLWKLFYEPSEHGALNAVILKIPAIAFVALGVAWLAVAWLFARRLWLQELAWQAWACGLVGVVLLITCAGLAEPILHPAGEPWLTSLARLTHRLLAVSPEPYRWLNNPETAMLACIIPMVWAGTGPGCLIYLAALKGIPDDFYEAADLDGANFIDQILFVVFPTLRPLVIINFVGTFIGAWYGAAGNILVMTGGNANTEVADLHIWYKAFTFLKFGPATAMAWMLGFMLIGFTVHQLRILSRVEFRTTTEKK